MAKSSIYKSPYRKEGDNTKYMEFLGDMMLIPKIDLYECTVEELNEVIVKYLEINAKHDMRIGLANFALALHISLFQLKNHLARKTRISDEIWEKLMEVNSMLNAALEDGMVSGSTNTVGSIFVAKNNFGYRDLQETTVIHENRRLSAEELKALADNLPDVIDAEYAEISDLKLEDKENGQEKYPTDDSV